MEIDLVFDTKIDHLYVLNLALKKMVMLNDIRSVFIITNKKYFKYFPVRKDIKINLIDEDSVLPDMTLNQLSKLSLPFFPKRSGWYFQQFLKLGISKLDDLSENYLVLDADTIFLQRIPLFDNGRFVFTKAQEYHKPYFENYINLLKESPSREFSFISQYMLFNKNIVTEMLNKIESNFNFENHWNWIIINNLLGDDASLFSEYETYGNYIKNHYPEKVCFLDLKWLREGSKVLGSLFPKIEDIEKLHGYYFVSFELNTVGASFFTKVKKHLFCFLYPRFSFLKRIIYKVLPYEINN